MASYRYIFPNALTSLNLLLGSVAIVFVFEGNTQIAIYLIILAAICDFLDGFAARLLNAKSAFGVQLDSLADLVSFCVAPSFILYRLISHSIVDSSFPFHLFAVDHSVSILIVQFSPFLIVVAGALRLARFNITKGTTNYFMGMPVPAVAFTIIAIEWTVNYSQIDSLSRLVANPFLLIIVIILLSFLMISGIKMISLKFQSMAIRQNLFRYLLLVGSVIIFIIMGINGLLIIMIYYLLLSVVINFTSSA